MGRRPERRDQRARRVDFRSFFSGRGVTTNFVSPIRPGEPDHLVRAAVRPGHPGRSPTGLDRAPDLVQPGQGDPHARSLGWIVRTSVDKYGLDAYIYDSTNDNTANYDRVLFARNKDAADPVADLREGRVGRRQGQDQSAALLDGKTAGMLVKVEALTTTLSQVRLFHTSVSRANATWPSWPGRARLHRDFEEYVAQTFPTSHRRRLRRARGRRGQRGDLRRSRPCTGRRRTSRCIEYLINTYQPDLALVGYPATDEFQHQFLGLVSPTLPNGEPNPAYDDIDVNGTPDGRVQQREAFIRRAYEGADTTMRLAQDAAGQATPTTFVGSDHGSRRSSWPSTPARCWSTSACCPSRRPRTAARPTGETIGKAKACWAGGAVQIYLNLAGRDPGRRRRCNRWQLPTRRRPWPPIKAAFLASADPNDWTR